MSSNNIEENIFDFKYLETNYLSKKDIIIKLNEFIYKNMRILDKFFNQRKREEDEEEVELIKSIDCISFVYKEEEEE